MKSALGITGAGAPMRLLVWFAVLVAGCAAPAKTPSTVTNHEAPGNLQARSDIGCLKPAALRNTYTAADLYRSNAECVKRDDLESAIYSAALGGVYARYDTLRVADTTAHQAQSVLMLNLRNALTEQQTETFYAALSATARDPDKLATICTRVKAVGPPNYHPTYMIQHGMRAFTGGGGGGNGLIANFDSKAAWEKSLDTYLHCPGSSSVTYSGGDGSSAEQAVVILNAGNSAVGIRAERDWLTRAYPGFTKKLQSLTQKDTRLFDVIQIELPDGTRKTVYFDITDFFGKL